MSKSLTGKVAVVTGASKGIGAAIALELAAQGAAVVVNFATSKAGAEKIVGQITAQGGKAFALQANLADESETVRLFAETKKAFGRLDVLVNNAGIYEFAPIDEVGADGFHKLFNLNVLGLLIATREAVKHFGPDGGSVVNISSVAADGFPGASVYAATKGAVNSITKSLAKELGPRKIRVNAVNPGMVDTEGFRAAGIDESDMRTQVEGSTPLGRIGQPQDIAPAVAFLASPAAGWVTGETLYISGGLR